MKLFYKIKGSQKHGIEIKISGNLNPHLDKQTNDCEFKSSTVIWTKLSLFVILGLANSIIFYYINNWFCYHCKKQPFKIKQKYSINTVKQWTACNAEASCTFMCQCITCFFGFLLCYTETMWKLSVHTPLPRWHCCSCSSSLIQSQFNLYWDAGG